MGAKADVIIAANATGANQELGKVRASVDDVARSADRASQSLGKMDGGAEVGAGAFGKFTKAVKGSRGEIGSFHGVADNLDKILGRMGGPAGGVGKFSQAISGLAGGLAAGGPFGIAIGAATVGLGVLANKFMETRKEAEALDKAGVGSVENLAEKIEAAIKGLRSEAMVIAGIDPLKQAFADLEDEQETLQRRIIERDTELMDLEAVRSTRNLARRQDLRAEIETLKGRLDVVADEFTQAAGLIDVYEDRQKALGALKGSIDRLTKSEEESAKAGGVRLEIDHEAIALARLRARLSEEVLQAESDAETDTMIFLASARRDAEAEGIARRQREHQAREQAIKDRLSAEESAARDIARLREQEVRDVERAEQDKQRAREMYAMQAVGLAVSTTDRFLDALEDAVAGNDVAWYKIGVAALRGAGTMIIGHGAQQVASGISKLGTPAAPIGMKEIGMGGGLIAAGTAMGGVSAVASGLMGRAAPDVESDSLGRERSMSISAAPRRGGGSDSSQVVVEHHYHAAVIGDATEASRRVADYAERDRRDLLGA